MLSAKKNDNRLVLSTPDWAGYHPEAIAMRPQPRMLVVTKIYNHLEQYDVPTEAAP